MRARPVRRPRTRPRWWLCALAVLLLAGLASCGVQAGAVLGDVIPEVAKAHGLFTHVSAAGAALHAAFGDEASRAAAAAAGLRAIVPRRRKDEEDKGRAGAATCYCIPLTRRAAARDAEAQAAALEVLKPDGAAKMPESKLADLPLCTPPADEDEFDLLSLKGFFRAVTCKGKTGHVATVLLPGGTDVIERLRCGEATRGNCSHLTKTHSSTGGACTYTCEHAPERTRAAQAAAAEAAGAEATQPRGTKDKRRGPAKLRATGVKGARKLRAVRFSG